MRIIHKYKIYTKTRDVSNYPTRILKFKRTKWLILKKLSLKKDNLKLSFNNNELVKMDAGQWFYMQNAYRNKVLNKRSLLILFNNNKRALRSLKTSSKKDIIALLKKYFRLYFRIDYALFNTKLSSTVYSVKERLNERNITLNGSPILNTVALKSGDFVRIKDDTYSYEVVANKYTFSESVSTCFELDYYTQSLIVVKDLNDSSNEDFSISVGEYLGLNTIE